MTGTHQVLLQMSSMVSYVLDLFFLSKNTKKDHILGLGSCRLALRYTSHYEAIAWASEDFSIVADQPCNVISVRHICSDMPSFPRCSITNKQFAPEKLLTLWALCFQGFLVFLIGIIICVLAPCSYVPIFQAVSFP